MEMSELEKIVYDAKPELEMLVHTNGDKSYPDYLKERILSLHVLNNEHTPIFWKAYEKMIRKFFDTRMYLETKDELAKNFFASTADHGGPLCHPFFSNAFCARADIVKKQNKELVFTLPCSSISLDNSSFPRGLFFHDENLQPIRLPIKSLFGQHSSVYATTPYTHADIRSIQEKIPSLMLSAQRKHVLLNLITNIYDSPEQYTCATYDEQMVRANWKLTKHLQGYEHIEYISFSQELFVRELIQSGSDTIPPLSDILYNKLVQNEYIYHFADIIGAHTKDNKKGTHLFWGLTKKGVRIQLQIGEHGWYTSNGTLFVQRTREAIHTALKNNELYPSMSLCFIVLSFVHGITVGGGFSQINYLGDMKKAYTAMEKKFNWPRREIPQTNIFTGEYVGHVLEKGGTKISATLIDVILYQSEHTVLEWESSLSQTSLRENVYAMMPEYYKIITGKQLSEEEKAHFPLPPATLHIPSENDNK